MLNLDSITTDGTFTLTESGEARDVTADLVSGYVVALGALDNTLDLMVGALFGRWTDEADGTVYWDRVEVIADQAEALRIGRERAEIAIWDLAQSQEIRCDA